MRLARLPIHFLVLAVAAFGLGMGAAPFAVGDLLEFFYQPLVLALTHVFTLGWITAAIMGVMYRFVPALTKAAIRWPRLAILHLWLFVVGVSGMVAHLAIGRWVGTWLAAGLVVASVGLFALNIVPCLVPAVRRRGLTETGLLLAVLHLLGASLLGLLLALDKTFAFLHRGVLANLAGHAHLAALGWVSLTISAVSYRVIPAFLLPDAALPRAAAWQVYGLAVAAAGLGVSLLGGIGGAHAWALASLLALVTYVAILAYLISRRRMPIDWTIRHVIAALACLLLASVLGVSLLWIDPGGAFGSRVAGAYALLGLLGWVTNFIVGVSYQLFPGFIAGLRVTLGWPRVTTAEICPARPRPAIFIALNAGVIALASGLVTAHGGLARSGAILMALGGLGYVAVMAWTLSYAYRASLPPAARDPLRVLSNE
jgi:hypothetical protein